MNERERDALRRPRARAANSSCAERDRPSASRRQARRPGTSPRRVLRRHELHAECRRRALVLRARLAAIRARRPDAELLLVGSHPTRAVRRLHSPENGIEVTGTVDDVRPYLWQSAVADRAAADGARDSEQGARSTRRGTAGRRQRQVFEGLPPSVHQACRLAVSADAFAKETLSLLDLTGSQRRALAASADLERLSWESQLLPLYRLLSDASAAAAIAV